MPSHAARVLIAVAAYVVPLACNLPTEARDMASHGRSDYQIHLTPEASPSEKLAAKELQTYFQQCTGVDLPIVTEQPAQDVPTIVLGCGPAAESLGVKPTPASLEEQGYTLRTVGDHVVIAGTPAAGTLYGVYDFLETCLGVRWFAPGVTKAPKTDKLELPNLDRTVKPAFQWRHTSYTRPGRDPALLAHNRDNAGGGGADHLYGTQYAFDGTCHS